MLILLYKLDVTLFLFLNVSVANPFFDRLMPFITEADHWKIPLALAWFGLLLFGGKKGRITAVLAVIILTLTDQISSALIKPLVGRVRPCFVVEGVRLLIDQSGSPSFPSSHAANNAAIATLFSIKYPKSRWIFIPLAACVAYSRIYVGVHYPSDAVGGALIGIALAFATIWAGNKGLIWLGNRIKPVKNNSAAPRG